MLKNLLFVSLFFLMNYVVFAQPEIVTELPEDAYKYSNFISFKNQLYFSIRNELWTSDGTSQGTRRIVLLNYDIAHIQVSENELFISTKKEDGHYYSLNISDGTESGTYRLTDTIYSRVPNNFTFINGETFFIGSKMLPESYLWKTNGTALGTNIHSISMNNDLPQNLTKWNNYIYYSAGGSFWRTNALAEAPEIFIDVDTIEGLNQPVYMNGILGVIDDKLIFSVIHPDPKDESEGMISIYSINKSGNISLIKSIESLKYIYTNLLGRINNKILFEGLVIGSSQLWITDGTTSGTQAVDTDLADDHISNYFPLGDKLGILIESWANPHAVWIYDEKSNILQNEFLFETRNASHQKVASVGSVLFFADHLYEEEGNGDEMWEYNLLSDETSKYLKLKNLTEDPNDDFLGAANLINVNDTLFFITGKANQYDLGRKNLLWRYSGPFLSEQEITSVSKVKAHDVKIFPVPSKEKIFLSNADGLNVKIFNSMGKELLSVIYREHISLDDLSEGVYFLRIEGIENNYKFIKVP